MKLFVLLFLSLVATARGQADFRATFGAEDLLEGGRVERLTVTWSNYTFNIRPPKGWFRQMDDASRKIVFTSQSGKSAIAVQFTSASPGELPPQDELRPMALASHPGAGIIQTGPCPTSSRPGVFFDLVRVPAPNVMQKIRHAYVSTPLGDAEFVLTASEDEFEKDRFIFMGTVRPFRADPIKPAPK